MATCKRCQMDGLTWRKVDGEWHLYSCAGDSSHLRIVETFAGCQGMASRRI